LLEELSREGWGVSAVDSSTVALRFASAWRTHSLSSGVAQGGLARTLGSGPCVEVETLWPCGVCLCRSRRFARVATTSPALGAGTASPQTLTSTADFPLGSGRRGDTVAVRSCRTVSSLPVGAPDDVPLCCQRGTFLPEIGVSNGFGLSLLSAGPHTVSVPSCSFAYGLCPYVADLRLVSPASLGAVEDGSDFFGLFGRGSEQVPAPSPHGASLWW
jgi:hypothetical protein